MPRRPKHSFLTVENILSDAKAYLNHSLEDSGSMVEKIQNWWKEAQAQYQQPDMPLPHDFMLLVSYDEPEPLTIIGELNASKKLGLDEQLKTITQLHERIHEKQTVFVTMLAKAAFDKVVEYRVKGGNGYIQYSSNIPFRLSDEMYHWVHQTVIPYFFDSHNNLKAALIFYNILKEYDGEAMLPRIHANHISKMREAHINEKMRTLAMDYVKQYFKEWKRFYFFTDRQLEILRYYHENPTAKIESAAHELGIKYHTLNEHNQKIKVKANNILPKEFGHPREIASYLVDQGLKL